MSENTTINVFVLMNEEGDYVVSKEQDTLLEVWDNDIGGDTPIVSRVLAITLNVELPSAAQLSANVPLTGNPVTMTVKSA